METDEPSVYVDFPLAVDYCRAYSGECELTTKSIDALHNELNSQIEISENVRAELDDRIFDLQGMFEYLLGRAEKYVYEEDYDDPEAAFCRNVLTRQSITEGTGTSIPERFEEAVAEARSYVSDRGLKQYMIRLKKTLGDVSTLHSRLSGILRPYSASSVDRFWAKNAFEQFTTSETHLTSLVDAHYWSKSSGDVVLIRTGDRGGYDFDAVKSELTDDGAHDVKVETPRGIERRRESATG